MDFLSDCIVDIVLILVFSMIAFIYSKRGFVKVILSSASWLVAFIASRICIDYVYNWLYNNTSIFANLSFTVSKSITMVLLFILFMIAIKLIIYAVDKLFKLPVLKQANAVLGLALGIICGLVAIIIICILLQIASGVVYNSDFIEAVNHSFIVKFVASQESTVGKFLLGL